MASADPETQRAHSYSASSQPTECERIRVLAAVIMKMIILLSSASADLETRPAQHGFSQSRDTAETQILEASSQPTECERIRVLVAVIMKMIILLSTASADPETAAHRYSALTRPSENGREQES